MSDTIEAPGKADPPPAPAGPTGGRRRPGRWIVVGVLIVIVAWIWTAYGTDVLAHGGSGGGLRCTPEAPTEEVAGTFGGPGEVVTFTADARCDHFFTVQAASWIPVTVLGVELADPDMVNMITFDEVARSNGVLYTEVSCIGCPEVAIPFEPIRLQPDEEVGIHLRGTMDPADCASMGPGGAAVHERHKVGVRVLGFPRTMEIDLQLPFSVRRGEGADDTCPA